MTARAAALCLLWGSGATAATVIAGPGTPETLIFDAHLTLYSAIAVRRGTPAVPSVAAAGGLTTPPGGARKLIGTTTVLAAWSECVVAMAISATSTSTSVGVLWAMKRCRHPAPDEPAAEPLGIAGLYLPPPPAPFWPASGPRRPVPLPQGGGAGGARIAPAPIPLPMAGALLPFGLLLLGIFRRRPR